MAVNLKFKDETMTGNVLRTWTVPVVYERATVAEIICTRVEREVEKYNQSAEDYFNGLVQPSSAEVSLNGYRQKKKQFIDPKEQKETALRGFSANAFIVLINDRQAESLEEMVEVNENTEISFIKLTPLVGG